MEIRTFTEADRKELRELFERAGEGAPTASLWGHPESEAAIYLYPYMELEPESLFLAVRDGVMVGYLTGCVDTASFPGEDKLLEQAIRRHWLLVRPRPMAFFARALIDTAWAAIRRQPTASGFTDPRWPAHLHINVALEARGTGAAEALMRAWQDRLKKVGSPGCHLQTLVENTRAVRFFERMGFIKHGPTPLVAGIRHKGGRLHQQTMVWTP